MIAAGRTIENKEEKQIKKIRLFGKYYLQNLNCTPKKT